jgi:hypothetical protein
MQSAPIRETTVCELSESGEAMNGHAVRLRAIYITDLKHTTILKDRQCRSVSLSVLDAEEPVDASLQKFDEAVWGQIDDLNLRIFLIDASGVFAQQSGEPRGAFTIQKIWDFRRLRGNDWKTAE